MADAILRDAVTKDGVAFRKSEEGKVLDTASIVNATGRFELCPTALLFGLWDSTGPKGGLGVKFQRALVSEVVGIDVQQGVRPASRIDPLAIPLGAGPIFRTPEGEITLDASAALKKEGKPVLFAKNKKGEDVSFDAAKGALPDEGRPSKANHGNVTPSLRNSDTRQPHHVRPTTSSIAT
jgi:CRISPR-associated protein Csb1